MNELHSHRALAHAGGYALHRTVADISHGKQAGNIGLQQKRIAVERPPLGPLSIAYQIRAGQDKAVIQSVCGCAPMKMNIEVAGTLSTLFVSEQSTRSSSNRVSPYTPATLAWAQI